MNNAKERFLWSESDIEWLDVEVQRGGPGSGHFGHAGRPGEVGGSAPSSGQGVAEGEAPYGTEGKKRIVRIISVRDTRDYDDSSGEWKPIPGTGEEHYCDRCGKVHEIHATVELEDESYCVVGTTCARAEFSEQLRKRMASKVRAAKRLRVLELEMAEKKKNQQEWDSALAEVRGLSLPEVTFEEDTSFQGRPLKKARMGDAAIHFSIQDTFNDERRKTLINSWQMKRMNELGFGSVRPHFDKVKYEKDIARTLATLEREDVIERGGPGSGHHGHAGRPGEVGGSLPSGQAGQGGRRVAEADAPYAVRNGKWSEKTKSKVMTFIEEEWNPTAAVNMRNIVWNFWVLPDGRLIDVSEHADLGIRLYRRFGGDLFKTEDQKKFGRVTDRELKAQGFVRTNFHPRPVTNVPTLFLELDVNAVTSDVREAITTMYWIAYEPEKGPPNVTLDWADNKGKWNSISTSGIGGKRTDIREINRKVGFKINRSLAIERGGPGSGHHDHEGRPGEVGGSLPSGQAGSKPAPQGGSRVAEADAPYVDEDEYRPKLDDFATWADTDALVWIDADNGDGTFDIEIISGHDRGASYDNVLADDLWEPDLDEIHLWIDKGPDESIGRAVESFGLTEDPREAGYILPDGTFLNLSGSNQGGEPGMRSLDHRDIGRILLDEEPGGTEGMVYFMDQTGAIRMNWATGYPGRADLSVDFAQTPTSDQKETLEYLLAEAAFLAWDYTIYDAEANDFRTVESRQIQDPTFDDLSQVFRDIKSADMRERSMLHRIFNMLSALVGRGGPGSGHYDHEGRPGEVGGSLPSGAVGPDQPKGGRGVAEGEAPYGVGDSIKASELPDLAYGDKNKVLASLDSLQNYVQNIARGERGERGQPGDERISKLLWELERQQGKAGDAQEHTYRRSWRAYNAFKDWMDREGIEPSMYFTDALAVLEPFAAEYDRVARDQIEQILERQESEGVGRREVSEEYLATVEGDTWRQHQIAVALGTGIGSFGPPWLEFDNVEAWDTKRGYDPRELMDDLINGGSVFTDKTKDAVFKAWLERAQTPGTGEWGFAKGIEAETGMSAEAFAFDAVAHSSQDRWVPSDESSQLWATAQLLNDGWQRSTQTPGGMLITEIASEIWGGESIDRERSTSSAEKLDRIDEPAVRAEATSVLESAYEKTQALFSEWGLKEGDTIRLFRGMNNAGDERWNPDGRFGAAEVDMWAASSWSSDLRSAHLFAKDSERGAIVVANVPIERILTTWYTGFPAKGEREYIVLGQDGIDSKVYFKNEGAFTIESYADPERFKTFDDLVARAKGPWRFHIDRVNADWLREYRDSLTKRGGPGSGHHGHAGRPGEVGGSQPSGQGGRRVAEGEAPYSHVSITDKRHWEPIVKGFEVAYEAREIDPWELKDKAGTTSFWLTPDGRMFTFGGINSHQMTAAGALGEANEVEGWTKEVQDAYQRWRMSRLTDTPGLNVIMEMGFVRGIYVTGRNNAIVLTLEESAPLRGAQKRVIEDIFSFSPEQEFETNWSVWSGESNVKHSYDRKEFRAFYSMVERVERGGPGSGHHDHKGRPGEVGGSAPSGAILDPSIPDDIRATRFFHAADSEEGAQKRLASGDIQVGPGAGGREFLAPVAGRTYATSDLEYALIYALGGDIAGNEVGEWMQKKIDQDGRYGYIFEIDNNDLNNIQPDEDAIGRAIWKQTYPWLNGLAEVYLSDKMLHKVMDGEYIYWAKSGKILVDHINDKRKYEMIRDGASIANAGNLGFKNIWRVDKYNLPKYPKINYSEEETSEKKQARVDGIWELIEPDKIVERGGPGSGHHEHAGRPGEVGGSAPSGASKPRKIGGGRVSEAAPVYGVKPSSRQAADMMRRNYGVAEDIGVAAWIGPDGEGLAPKKDHQITAKDVLKKLGMHPDTYRNSITATVNMIDLGLIRYTRFQDIHGFTLPQSKITNAQKEAIVTIMARARGKRSGLDFLFDKAVVEPQQEHRYLEKMDGRQVVDMLDLNTDFWEVTPTTIRVVHRGGPGSGHFGHKGRPGEVGGSLPGTGFKMKAGGRTFLDKSEAMEWTADQMRKLGYEVNYLFSDTGRIFEHSSISPTNISYSLQDLAARRELTSRPENTGLVDIHNHPSVDLKADYPPSFSDFSFAMKRELDEWWVVTPNGKYVVKRGEAAKLYYSGSDPYTLETAWNKWVDENSDNYFAGILRANPSQGYFHLATESADGAEKFTRMRVDLIQEIVEDTGLFDMEWVPNE